MKSKFLSTAFLLLILATFSYAIAPRQMSFQAIVRDANQNLLVNTNVGVRISIVTSPDATTPVYTEEHQSVTNQNGLLTVVIGSKSPVEIDWTKGPYYIQTEIDPTGGSNYTVKGSSELLSVPYALYAQSAGNSGSDWKSLANQTISYPGKVAINTEYVDAQLKVEDHNPSDTTVTISAHANGGTAIKGFSHSTSNRSWMNAGVVGQSFADSLTEGRGVWGSSFGNPSIGFGVQGESSSEKGSNYGVAGYGISREGNTKQTYGGLFHARGEWDESLGVGTGTHVGALTMADGRGQTNMGVNSYARNAAGYNRGIQSVAFGDASIYNQAGIFFAEGLGNEDPASRNTAVHGQAINNKIANYGIIGTAFANLSPAAMVVGATGYANGSGGNESYGVDGTTSAKNKTNYGVAGFAFGELSADSINIGVYGFAEAADTSYGVFASATGSGNEKVNYGLYAEAANGSEANYAGYFNGNVFVKGVLQAEQIESPGAAFIKTDNPSDPQNSSLVHSVVESAEMLRVFSGNALTDAAGYARVILPDYVYTSGSDFRYQLTTIGSFANAIIREEIGNNGFLIQTSEPAVKVSWQLTAVRTDRFALENPIRNIVPKTESSPQRSKIAIRATTKPSKRNGLQPVEKINE